jgi:hypothetical protein
MGLEHVHFGLDLCPAAGALKDGAQRSYFKVDCLRGCLFAQTLLLIPGDVARFDVAHQFAAELGQDVREVGFLDNHGTRCECGFLHLQPFIGRNGHQARRQSFLDIALLAASPIASRASVTLQNNIGTYVTSGTTVTLTFTGVTNPDVGIVSDAGAGPGSITSVSGCGVASWQGMLEAGNDEEVFVATYLTPGTCTVTVTLSAAPSGDLIAQGEYVGVATQPLAFNPAGSAGDARIPTNITSAVYPFITYEPNDVLVMIGHSNESSTATFSSTAGTSLTAHTALTGGSSVIQYLDASLATAGSYSTTVANSASNTSFFDPLVLRTQMPTGPAVVQQNSAFTNGLSVSTLSVTPLSPTQTGRWLLLTESNITEADNTLTDSLGTCGEPLPNTWGNATAGIAYLCQDTTLGRPVFTLTSSIGNQRTDMILLGVQDVDSVFPLYGGGAWTNVFAADVGPNVTTQDNGPLTVPGGQCFLLAGFGGGTTNKLYTANSGFNLRSTWAWNNDITIQNTWDQQVCPGSQTTYDFTMTSPTAQGGLESGMWAFGATTNTTWPVISEATGVQFNNSQTSFTLRNPLVGGESITVCAGSSGSGAPTIASTPSLTWTKVGGGSNDYAVWVTTAAPSGNLNIQVGPTSSTFEDVAFLVNRNVGGLDTSASAYSGTGATLNPSVTTTQAADF